MKRGRVPERVEVEDGIEDGRVEQEEVDMEVEVEVVG